MSIFNVFFVVLFAAAIVIAAASTILVVYRRYLRKIKGIERGLKMVPLLIHLPPPSDDTVAQGRDVRDVMREKIAQAETLYNLIAGTAKEGLKSQFFGQRHLAFEIIATGGLVHFYAAVPVALLSTVEQAIMTAYPGARVEQAEDHNVFNTEGKLPGTFGGEVSLKNQAAYPIATYQTLEKDPMGALMNSLSKLAMHEGAGIQILIRPAGMSWTYASKALVKKLKRKKSSYSTMDLVKAPAKVPEAAQREKKELTTLEQQVSDAVEEKTKHPAFETLIRVLVSTADLTRSEQVGRDLATSFALYDAPGMNGFKFSQAENLQQFVTDFIFRFFPPEKRKNVLNSQEIATLLHLPDAQFTATSNVERQLSKQVDGPAELPATGLLFGYNIFRGVQKEIRLSSEDRRRHTYIVGQTGTGKSTMLENLAVQDMLDGNGFAFIDPHGDTAERLMSMVPKARAEDVIYFNPADTANPLGLNLFEFNSPEQKDFLIQESINMLYKIYDPGKTGIIGPRFEQWFRNAALTLMSDPAGATFIEIPKVFTDNDYLKQKFKYLTDPTVIDFWTKEMAQTSDYHKSEMLGWFVSKFGAFAQNEIMRDVIGQTKSAFDFREVMDNKKILIVNLSKGQLGELNANLLGMVLVIKFQAAAMSRANVAEGQRPDFCLYVDEFQNFSTDSFAAILSEARKYHLNLVVGNQYISQLTDEIRDAVFGNVGTVVSFRCGPDDAEFLEKQFTPTFTAHDVANIPNFNAVVRLLVNNQPTLPFSMTALPPLGVANPEMATAVKQLSAAKFGRPKAAVEADINARLQSATPPPKPSASPATPPLPSVPPLVSEAPRPPVVLLKPVARPAAPLPPPPPIVPAPPLETKPILPAALEHSSRPQVAAPTFKPAVKMPTNKGEVVEPLPPLEAPIAQTTASKLETPQEHKPLVIAAPSVKSAAVKTLEAEIEEAANTPLPPPPQPGSEVDPTIPRPAKQPEPAPTKVNLPNLMPGEVYVDATGKVHQPQRV